MPTHKAISSAQKAAADVLANPMLSVSSRAAWVRACPMPTSRWLRRSSHSSSSGRSRASSGRTGGITWCATCGITMHTRRAKAAIVSRSAVGVIKYVSPELLCHRNFKTTTIMYCVPGIRCPQICGCLHGRITAAIHTTPESKRTSKQCQNLALAIALACVAHVPVLSPSQSACTC